MQLICQLTGTYEVLLKAENGEEAIIHCSAGTVRNAACRNLSGLDALAVILTWSKGKYWLEELPVLPVRTINEPLDKVFEEVENRAAQKNAAPSAVETVFEMAQHPPPPVQPVIEDKTPAPELSPTPETKSAEGPDVTESNKPSEETKTEQRSPDPGETGPAPAREQPFKEGNQLAEKISAIDGTRGLIVASMDGTLLKARDIESGHELAQILALLGEALDQVAETFGKGKLVHGSIEFDDHRILVHPFKNTYVGTKINFDSSSAMIGSEIERLLKEES